MSAVGASSEHAGGPGPTGATVACGALGAYDPERVRRIAAALGDGMRPVHDDERSILYCDREPIRWGGERERGYAWIEGDVWRGDPASWEQASRLGACGLALEGRRRLVHSSVSGYARLYWIEDRAATYFASRVDALVRAWPRPLSVDWDAWAATIVFRHPVLGRTPFAEISRLGPHSALRRRLGRSRVEVPAWPWAEIEPRLSLDAGADAWVASLRETLAPLEGEILCPLSGGRDSRIVLCAIPADREVTAITVDDDEGGRFEEDHAAPVASILGVGHEELRGRAGGLPRRLGRARAPGRVPVRRPRLDGPARPAPRRRAGPGDRRRGDRRHLPGRRSLLHRGQPRHQPPPRRERGPVRDRAPLRPRPAGARRGPPCPAARAGARAVHGGDEALRGPSVAGHPRGLLDPNGPRDLELPDRAARSIGARDRPGSERRARLSGALDPAGDQARRPPLSGRARAAGAGDRAPARDHGLGAHAGATRRRWCSEPAVAAYRELLAEGPLAGQVAPELRAWLETPSRGELDGHLRMGMEAVALLHAWWRRYRDSLGEVDAGELARG